MNKFDDRLPCGHLRSDVDEAGACSACDGEKKSATFGPSFVEAHRSELARTITAYADGDAEALFERLRARFWGLNPEEWTKEERGEK